MCYEGGNNKLWYKDNHPLCTPCVEKIEALCLFVLLFVSPFCNHLLIYPIQYDLHHILCELASEQYDAIGQNIERNEGHMGPLQVHAIRYVNPYYLCRYWITFEAHTQCIRALDSYKIMWVIIFG